MKVRYVGKEKENFIVENNDIDLIPGKEYEVLAIERGMYRVVDESEEDYLYPTFFFETIGDE